MRTDVKAVELVELVRLHRLTVAAKDVAEYVSQRAHKLGVEGAHTLSLYTQLACARMGGTTRFGICCQVLVAVCGLASARRRAAAAAQDVRKWNAQKSLCVSELRPNQPPYTYIVSRCTTAECAERTLGSAVLPLNLTRSAAFSPSGTPGRGVSGARAAAGRGGHRGEFETWRRNRWWSCRRPPCRSPQIDTCAKRHECRQQQSEGPVQRVLVLNT